VRAERIALHHSGARELAWQTLDRLLVAVRPKRFDGGKCYEDHPKSKLHARGRANSPGITEARLTNLSKHEASERSHLSYQNDLQITQKFVDDNGGETINFIASLVLLVQHRGMPEVQAPPPLPKTKWRWS